MGTADLVHAHNYEAPLAAYAAQRLRTCPVIYNNHNTLAEELPQYFRGRGVQRIARWAGEALDRTIPRRADATIAISERAQPILKELGCQHVHHVPPGIDPVDLEGGRREATRSRLEMEGRPWVVYAGNPDAYQDLPLLLSAMEHLEEVGLLMVSASGLEAWEQKASFLPAARRRFVRARSWSDTRDLIVAADVAALPRTRCSGFPIKLLNTLGLGRPTVCSQGSWQALPGAVAVPNGDVLAFARELERRCMISSRREKLGREAQVYVRHECSWDARARDLERVYEDVLKRDGSLANS